MSRVSRVTCVTPVTWERNNYHKGRARLAYPLSPEWIENLFSLNFVFELELRKTKTKLKRKKLVFGCQPVEHFVPLHQVCHSGLVLLLLELLQSLMDALTEQPAIRGQSGLVRLGRRRVGWSPTWWNISCQGTPLGLALPERSHSEK